MMGGTAVSYWKRFTLVMATFYAITLTIAFFTGLRAVNTDGGVGHFVSSHLDAGLVLILVGGMILIIWHPYAYRIAPQRPLVGAALAGAHGGFLLALVAIDRFVYGTDYEAAWQLVLVVAVLTVGLLQISLSIAYVSSRSRERNSTVGPVIESPSGA